MKELSILISTMNRSDLSFLNQMFPKHDVRKLNLVIINQTTPQNQIFSLLTNHKVINSFDIGLSKSRNLAIANCYTKFALIADDDLIYKENFNDLIKQVISKHKNFGLIAFQLENEKLQPFKTYRAYNHEIKNKKQIENISSAEMLLNLELFKKNHLKFDTRFGINAVFPLGEEQVLAHQIKKKGIKMLRVNATIAQHKGKSSGQNPISDNFIKTAIALRYPYLKNLIYFWMFKYLIFLWRKKYISFKNFITTFKIMNQHLTFVKKHQIHGDEV